MGILSVLPIKGDGTHIASWNKTASIKFRVDVAMMCKLGLDISFEEMSPAEQAFCKLTVSNNNRIKNTVLNGVQYRLVSPYYTNHTAVMYVDETKSKAVLYTSDIHPRIKEKLSLVKLQGLDLNKNYCISETNLMPGVVSDLNENDKNYSGEYLMKIGLDALTANQVNSKVNEIIEQ